MLLEANTSIGASCLAAAALLAGLLALPCSAQEIIETRTVENAAHVREVTALRWWQSSVGAIGVAVGLTQLTRRRFGPERQHALDVGAPQPTVGLRYRLSERSSIALDTVLGRADRAEDVLEDARVLAQGFSKKSPSIAANLRSGLRFQMDSGFQMNVKVRRSGVRFIVKKDFY